MSDDIAKGFDDAELEPSAAEQLQEQDNNREIAHKLRNELFNHSSIKVTDDDPVIQLIIAVEAITQRKADYIAENLESTSENIIDNILAKQENVNDTFDEKLAELKNLLTKLEDQKEAIVLDVWRKLEQRVMEKIQSELTSSIKTIAENSNNSVNNERMALKGGLGGLIVGIIICAIVLFVLK